jgi:HAMP domain-containing protein
LAGTPYGCPAASVGHPFVDEPAHRLLGVPGFVADVRQNLEEGMSIHPWSWVYFVSFALIASFVLLKVLIGIIINSLEQARQIEHQREREERRALIAAARPDHRIDPEEGRQMIAEKLESVRDTLAELEEEIAIVHGGADGPPSR